MSEPKYPDPKKFLDRLIEPIAHEVNKEEAGQFQRDTVLACAEEVGHEPSCGHWVDEKTGKKVPCDAACKLLARAERLR